MYGMLLKELMAVIIPRQGGSMSLRVFKDKSDKLYLFDEDTKCGCLKIYLNVDAGIYPGTFFESPAHELIELDVPDIDTYLHELRRMIVANYKEK